MMPTYNSFLFTLLLILLQLTSIVKPSLITDRNALLAFKNSLTTLNPNNILAKNWSTVNDPKTTTTTSVCNWIGVTCGAKHQRVTALNISGFALAGTLPPHIGNLTFLRYLDISFNNFTGQIPSWLGELTRLETLSLKNNSFSGEIPKSLFNNVSCTLQMIDMQYNSLSGNIPEEIGSCSSLRIIVLEDNELTGLLPHGVFNLPSISEVWITSNRISGSLPMDLCNNRSSSLKFLALANNRLEGLIPTNIWRCRELELLSLSYNNFRGEIPSDIGRLSMLKRLYLGYNFFEGGIPAELGRLSRLEILSIKNSNLTRSIPDQIGNCTSLTTLDLSLNNLTGSLPSEWPLFNLERLLLNNNQLIGEIPSSVANFSKLTLLQIHMNSFSGSVPNFSSLRLLERLQLSDNNLSGTKHPNRELDFLLPLTNCRFLETVDVSRNPLNGILPTSIGKFSKSLYGFSADQCNITGVIPSSIGNLIGLQGLSFEKNRLTGFIPPTIGKLVELQGLFLNGNRLQGYIPHDLCRLSSIYKLHLDGNVLTGPIPACFGEMNSLKNLYLGSNNLNSTVPSEFWNLKDLVILNLSSNYLSGQLSSRIASLRAVNSLDLSHNQFAGDIPGSIDSCQSLVFLSLSNNEFEGGIPPSLGNLRGLSELDLSNNNLSGFIPNSFQDLRSLHSINVSYNKLQGEIPTGGPFVNFTTQSFLNNNALCGSIKFQVPPCPVKDNNRTSRVKKAVGLIKYILPSFVLVSALAAVIIFVLLKRRKQKRMKSREPADITPGATWKRISYIELVRGTNSFSTITNLLGRGSFGSVFKATLHDGLVVAVKVFDLQSERSIQSFDTECEILSNIRHRNLVRIIGCCSNPEFKALVLEHMLNGSLEKWLHSEDCRLNLTQLLQIAIEVASALEYLHHGHTFRIVHCDVKPSNVLLDKDMVAHLADFGISKLFEDGESMVHTKTLATIGYAAPEYGGEGKVSTNGDVYSYGILLLEMFTKKKPTDDMFSGEMSLREWVDRALQENAVTEVVAPDLLLSSREDCQSLTANEEECIASIFSLAMKCLASSPDERIDMIETASALQRIKAKVKRTTMRRRYEVSIIT